MKNHKRITFNWIGNDLTNFLIICNFHFRSNGKHFFERWNPLQTEFDEYEIIRFPDSIDLLRKSKPMKIRYEVSRNGIYRMCYWTRHSIVDDWCGTISNQRIWYSAVLPKQKHKTGVKSNVISSIEFRHRRYFVLHLQITHTDTQQLTEQRIHRHIDITSSWLAAQ